ncbi:hypothetical protein ABW19_dt0200897 [Dactylella cylindrospora]|nr:hypothetical protein ABW19_dt0200897 [Dactylella cylindrospora]
MAQPKPSLAKIVSRQCCQIEGSDLKIWDIVLDADGEIYTATLGSAPAEITCLDINNMTLDYVPKTVFQPVLSPSFGIREVPSSVYLDSSIYVKTPNLRRYLRELDPDLIKTHIIREAIILNALSRHPHRNIAKFHGCIFEDDRICGFALKRYQQTLEDRMCESYESIDIKRIENQVRAGIEHLHALGLVHNDINPSNIMFDEDGVAVIIDFDSCQPEDADIAITESKPGSFPFEVDPTKLFTKEHDLEALEMLVQWMEERRLEEQLGWWSLVFAFLYSGCRHFIHRQNKLVAFRNAMLMLSIGVALIGIRANSQSIWEAFLAVFRFFRPLEG